MVYEKKKKNHATFWLVQVEVDIWNFVHMCFIICGVTLSTYSGSILKKLIWAYILKLCVLEIQGVQIYGGLVH